jgi:hypothetical protein
MKIATGTKQSQQDMAEKSQPQQRRHDRDSDDGEGRFKSKYQEIKLVWKRKTNVTIFIEINHRD